MTDIFWIFSQNLPSVSDWVESISPRLASTMINMQSAKEAFQSGTRLSDILFMVFRKENMVKRMCGSTRLLLGVFIVSKPYIYYLFDI